MLRKAAVPKRICDRRRAQNAEINIQNTGGTDYAEQIIFKGSRYM